MENKTFVPWGDNLRTLLQQSKVSRNDIREVLKRRGLIVGSNDKENTAPPLIKTLLSPSESNILRDSMTCRESSSKQNFRSWEWTSENDLIDAVSEVVNPEILITDPFCNYEITDFSDFYVQGDNSNVVLDFELKRTDLLENWDNNEKYFKGRIELEKVNDESGVSKALVKVTLEHTSPETKIIINNVLRQLESSFKFNGHINEDQVIEKVLYKNFNNENRISFLKDLSSEHKEYEFYFDKMVDFQFKPDEGSEFSPEIKWLEENIEELKIKGDLKKTIFINKKELHKSLKIFKIVCRYTVSVESYSGDCKVSFEFPEFFRSGNESSELMIDFKQFKLPGASKSLQKSTKIKIMKNIELLKTKIIDSYKLVDDQCL